MKFGKRNILFKNHVEKETGRLVPDFIFYFEKALYKVKVSILQLRFNVI